MAEEYRLEDYPGYEPGKPPRVDEIHAIDYMDELEKIWGKRWGYQGIGKLREVAMCRPTEDEINPLFARDPNFFLMWYGFPDLGSWQSGHDDLRRLLESEGVVVHELKFPSPAVGPLWPHEEDELLPGAARGARRRHSGEVRLHAL